MKNQKAANLNFLFLHLENMKKLFKIKTNSSAPYDMLVIHFQLRRLEKQLNRLETMSCNGDIDNEILEKKEKAILDKVDTILNFRKRKIPVYINGDCRGYSLKIKSQYIIDNQIKIYQDWGQCGIIAPDFGI